EYEMGMIRDGLSVDIDALAFPGQMFKGKIVAITPVLDPMTRSVKVRAEVENNEQKLKPEMFVNAKIHVDLGEKLAVPESAVLDTGLRKIVYLAKEGDILESREITTGQKTENYYEVLDGLNEGDTVITSGNFLIDSESKLKAVLKND
ncbi:MAG: efflux RND transporter periplasmic adaptor subunit, partial [Candidatus Omnitrophica bacterium]|nr:efflux RND transporter periplasmic adaptor subunit [Candidatus Omnitrophota bacterium]